MRRFFIPSASFTHPFYSIQPHDVFRGAFPFAEAVGVDVADDVEFVDKDGLFFEHVQGAGLGVGVHVQEVLKVSLTICSLPHLLLLYIQHHVPI